jgi:hypothetical protein
VIGGIPRSAAWAVKNIWFFGLYCCIGKYPFSIVGRVLAGTPPRSVGWLAVSVLRGYWMPFGLDLEGGYLPDELHTG